MNGRQVSCVVFFFAAAITVVAGQHVSILDTTVTLHCPVEEDYVNSVKWFKAGQKLPEEKTLTMILDDYTDKNDGMYHCTHAESEKVHYFYVKAKVCKGCVDVDKMVAFAMVFADALITLGIVIMVYFFAKKKAGSAPPQRATQPRQPRGQARGPPIPDPDYQMLNPATRSNDIYAQAQSHRR